MPPVSSVEILPGTRPTQYYKKLKAWPWNIIAQQNTVGHKQKVSNKTNLHLKEWRELDNQPIRWKLILTGAWAWDKVYIPRVEAHSANKKMGWPYPRRRCWVTSVAPLMQGNANVNSVESPMTPQKQRIMTTSQMQIMITCHKPPRYVPYKCTYVPYNGTFGASDWGPMLDVWGWHPADVNAEVGVTPDVTTSLRKDTLNITRYLCRNQFQSIRSYRLDPRMDPVQWLLCTLTPV